MLAAVEKAERQRLISGLVVRKRIGSQGELAAALAGEGVRVAQATLSRDVHELRLDKVEDELGRPRYVLPAQARGPDPRAALAAALRTHGRSAAAAQNLVVVRSALGTAPAIARALDRLAHPLVVGTIAGDDTCLVVTPDAGTAAVLAAELTALLAV
jgi:transcriptional regulator of arginine metabolism